MRTKFALIAVLLSFQINAFAQHEEHQMNHSQVPRRPSECGDMMIWDYAMSMCMPIAMEGMSMSMFMVQANVFGVQTFQEGPRGTNAFSAPNMVMIDWGRSVGDSHYFNIDFMGTIEKWTFPKDGNPLLLQIGEENADEEPYLDAQHPHSSPIMGLTFSDTISLGKKNYLKLSFAPRGEATDGPVPFMHRPTGMVNPDAPLGHHVGQDVGHITSTVFAAALRQGRVTLEASAYHGEEPEPTKVDLPLGELDSYSTRLTFEFNENLFAMVSAAYVGEPEGHDHNGSNGPDHIHRYSASIYSRTISTNGWTTQDALIFGVINHADGVSALRSFGYEFLATKNKSTLWARTEVLERTGAELQIATADPARAEWITAVTFGYTHKLGKWQDWNIGLGGSATQDVLPDEFQTAYGGNPLTGKIFLQASGMKMKDL